MVNIHAGDYDPISDSYSALRRTRENRKNLYRACKKYSETSNFVRAAITSSAVLISGAIAGCVNSNYSFENLKNGFFLTGLASLAIAGAASEIKRKRSRIEYNECLGKRNEWISYIKKHKSELLKMALNPSFSLDSLARAVNAGHVDAEEANLIRIQREEAQRRQERDEEYEDSGYEGWLEEPPWRGN